MTATQIFTPNPPLKPHLSVWETKFWNWNMAHLGDEVRRCREFNLRTNVRLRGQASKDPYLWDSDSSLRQGCQKVSKLTDHNKVISISFEDRAVFWQSWVCDQWEVNYNFNKPRKTRSFIAISTSSEAEKQEEKQEEVQILAAAAEQKSHPKRFAAVLSGYWNAQRNPRIATLPRVKSAAI